MSIITTLYENIALPIKGLRWRYLPILIVYSCYGFAAVTAIGSTFWLKDATTLSAIELAKLGFWATLPFTCKLLLGQCIETINIAGNRRRSYLVLGALLTVAGQMILISAVNHFAWVTMLGSLYQQLLLANVVSIAGLMVQDLVADTLCAELVDPNANPEAKRLEIGTIQVLGRMCLMLAGFISMGLGGYLTEHYAFTRVVWWGLVAPTASILAAVLLQDTQPTKGHLDWRIYSSGIAIIALSIAVEFFDVPYAQEMIFAFNMLIILWLFTCFSGNYDAASLRTLILGALMIFMYRITPSLSPVSSWWQIDVLKFDPSFFATLSQIGSMLGFLGTWWFSSYLIKRDIGWVVVALSTIHALLFLPYLGMVFGLHHWTEQHLGFGARTIAMIDTTLSSPFTYVSMAPILAFFTFYAPRENKTVWFALAASFMNMALAAASLLDKGLIHLFAIERGNYQNIAPLYVTELLFIFVIPVTTVGLCHLYGRR
jgi:hypothetical protein